MSLGKIYSVHCDCPVLFPGWHARSCSTCVGWVAEESSGADARKRAEAAGWKRVTGRVNGVTNAERSGWDLCPACRDEVTR